MSEPLSAASAVARWPLLGVTILRVVTGFCLFTHGVSKLFLHVDGAGSPTFVQAFVPVLARYGLPAPALFAWAVALLEFGGGLLFMAGWLVRPLAAYYAFQLTLGIILLHRHYGWYVVGPGRNGAEYNVLLIGALVCVAVAGPGARLLGRQFLARASGTPGARNA
jgi:putative oxidoreductase